MAEKPFEEEDPFSLNGMILQLPREEAKLAEAEMAACFIEEYALLGYDEEAIYRLFQDPFYRGTHAVLETRGEAFVRGLIRDICGGKEMPAHG